MFAEAAIFGGTHYPANAAAIEDSVTAFFPRDAFTDLLARSPQMSLKMIASLSAFVREFNQKLEDLSLREVPARLAAYLLNRSEQSGRPEIVLDLTKTELARTLGTISETLSRCLRKMIDRGMIEVDGARIVITDPARLAAVADGDKI